MKKPDGEDQGIRLQRGSSSATGEKVRDGNRRAHRTALPVDDRLEQFRLPRSPQSMQATAEKVEKRLAVELRGRSEKQNQFVPVSHEVGSDPGNQSGSTRRRYAFSTIFSPKLYTLSAAG